MMQLLKLNPMKDLSLIIFPTLLALAHLLGSSIKIPDRKGIVDLEAFSAGFSVAYVFIVLIPEIFNLNPQADTRWPMILIILGFSFFYISLRFVYFRLKHTDKPLLSEIIHIGAMATFSFVLAYSVTELVNARFGEGIFLLGFAIVHVFLSEIWENREFHNRELTSIKPIVMIMSTMLGGIISIAGISNPHATTALYSFAAGSLIYIAIREELPNSNSSRPAFFLFGALSIIISFLIISVLQ